MCEAMEIEGREEALDKHGRHRLVEAQQHMADAGLRVLAFAWRRLETGVQAKEAGMVLSGLVGLYDPPGAGSA